MVRRTAIVFALVALAACSRARNVDQVEQSANAAACTRCHGGADNGTGAPPNSLHGSTATSDIAVGAHSAHVVAGTIAGAFPCTTCHPDPRNGSRTHGNGNVEVAFGSLGDHSLAGAGFDPATGTCSSVYCHGAFKNGNAANAPAWTNVGKGAAGCGTCHGVPPAAPHPTVGSDLTGCRVCHPETIDRSGNVIPASAGGKHLDGKIQSSGHGDAWMVPTSDGFHAYAANADLRSCTECHGPDLSGGPVGVGCGNCHDANLPAGVASWKVNCVMCHGGTDNGTGAPPRTIRGQSGDAVRVGAHTKHVTGSALTPPIGCEVCHPRPADALTPGHVDGGRANVTFSGIAVQGLSVSPAWNPSTRTCALYCHGATLGGGSNRAPDWTGGPAEATCGSCHGLPPPAPHPAVTGGLTMCAGCHPNTVDASGAVIAPSSGGKHLDGVVEVASAHGASWMDPQSTSFHAYSADRGLGACQACHGPALNALPNGDCAKCHGAGWSNKCTMCHGGDAGDTAGAPPKATYGNGGDAVRIGAHRAHVGGARALDCAECHVKPASAFTAGHIDEAQASVTFGALAKQGVAAAPAWDRATRTCANTYCHGAAFADGTRGTLNAPDWTGGAAQAACGTCHKAPPAAPHPQTSNCASCHGAGYSVDGVTAATHVDGNLDLLPMSCTSCHGDASRPAPGSAAPPVDSHGNVDPGAPGVGAHLAHVQDGKLRAALSCSDCHVVPTSTSHANGTTDFAWSPLATEKGATKPQYTGGRCSASYCHGSTLGAGGSNHQPLWTGGAAEAQCSSCHGAPPPAPHPQNVNCGGCHGAAYSVSAGTADPATHVNGTLDLGEMGCTSCHGDATKTATPQDPANAAPPTDTAGLASSEKVGAHQVHVRGTGASKAAPVACTECHPVPTSLAHSDAITQVTFGPLAKTTGASPVWNGGTITCSSTYCHGAYTGTFTYYPTGSDVTETITYAGKNATPAWTDKVGCGSCHGAPPPGQTWHTGYHAGGNDCSLCHPDAQGTAASGPTITNASMHVDGKVDVSPKWTSSCFKCH